MATMGLALEKVCLFCSEPAWHKETNEADREDSSYRGGQSDAKVGRCGAAPSKTADRMPIYRCHKGTTENDLVTSRML